MNKLKTSNKLSHFSFPIIVTGSVLSIVVAALDETIVSAISSDIMREFSAFDKLGWIGCAFLLTTTVFQPILAKLCEYIKSEIVMLFCLCFFALGSMLCALSTSITMFIVSRAILGIGTSGLFLLPFVIVSNLVEINKRGIYIAYFEAIFCLSNLAGPLFGSSIAAFFGWRVIFLINLPIVVLAILSLFISVFIPQKTTEKNRGFSQFDFIGSILLIVSVSLILLGASLDRNLYPWNSLPTVSCLVVGAVGLIVLMCYELKIAKDPFFPKEVFVWNTFITICISFVLGFMFYVLLYYIPYYYKTNNYDSTTAAVKLTYLLLSSTITLPISGYFTDKLKSYKPFLILGMAFISAGTLSTVCCFRSINEYLVNAIYCITGIGFGLCFQNNIIAAQTALSNKKQHISAITSILSFFLALGGTFGIRLSNTVFDSSVIPNLRGKIEASKVVALMKEVDKLKEILGTDSLVKYAVDVFNNGFRMIYIFGLPFAILGLLSSFLLRNTSIQNSPHGPDEEKRSSSLAQ